MVAGARSRRGPPVTAPGPMRPSGSMTQLAVSVRAPSGPAFTVVLVCHVAAVLVALVALVSGAIAAARLRHARGDLPQSVRSYFAPGTNWAGRVLYLVPAFGAALLAMSGGAYRPDAPWVEWGMGLWVAATLLAEGVVWPAERRIRRALAVPGEDGVPASARGPARTVCISSVAVVAILVAAMVVMVAKP